MNTKTPRTDAVAYDAGGVQHDQGAIVSSEFARELERELNDLKREVDLRAEPNPSGTIAARLNWWKRRCDELSTGEPKVPASPGEIAHAASMFYFCPICQWVCDERGQPVRSLFDMGKTLPKQTCPDCPLEV